MRGAGRFNPAPLVRHPVCPPLGKVIVSCRADHRISRITMCIPMSGIVGVIPNVAAMIRLAIRIDIWGMSELLIESDKVESCWDDNHP